MSTEPVDAPPVPDLVIGDDGLARPVWASTDELLRDYYDTEWGMPVRDERGVFERLSLEAFQSGLSWRTILAKRPAFRAAFADFDADTVAAFGEDDVAAADGRRRDRPEPREDPRDDHQRERHDRPAAGRRARRLRVVVPAGRPRPSHGPPPRSRRQSDESVALSKALRKRGFAFVGPTTMYALMEALGIVDTHLMGSHRRGTSGVWS